MAAAAGLRWRKAMIVSLIFHSIVLVGVGWLAVRAVLPVELPETIIELELAGEPEGASLPAAAPEAAAVTASQPVTAPVPTPVVWQRVPQPVQPEVAETEAVVAVSSSLNVISVDNTAASSSQTAGGGGTDSAGNGSGSGGSGGGASGGTGGGQAVPQGTIPPRILSQREPPYPERARHEQQQGTVVLQIEIMENGRAGQVRVKASSGYELLDNAAVGSVQSWRFVPAKSRATGKSVACVTTLPIDFRLK